MQTAKNFRFKLLLQERCGSMSAAAYETGLANYVLSRIANGWTKPTAKQRRNLNRRFGKEKINEVLGAE